MDEKKQSNEQDSKVAVPYTPEEDTDTPPTGALGVKERYEDRLLAIQGVAGVGLGHSSTGDDAILVYLTSQSARNSLPAEIEGFEVRPVFTGEIKAQLP